MRKVFSSTIIIFILILGAFFRIYHLNEESLWLDEGITYYNSSPETYGGVWERVSDLDQSPPFYYFIGHTYLEFFGENEFGLRLIPVIFSILSILFLYLLLAEIWNREVGLIAAFLLAINPFHIGFSMESRMYILLSLESLMAFYFLVKAMRKKKGGMIYWLLFTLISVAGLYTHNFYAFILLALGATFWLLFIPAENKLAKFGMAIFSLFLAAIWYLPWIPHLIKQLKVDRYWMAENSFLDIKEYALDFVNRDKIILITFGILCVIGILWQIFSRRVRLHKEEIIATFSIITFLIIGFFVPLFFSIWISPILKIRYVIYILPVALSLVALGLYTLRRFNFAIIFPFLLFFLIKWAPWQLSNYPIEIREDFRRAISIIQEDEAPVMVHTPSAKHILSFYAKNNLKITAFPDSDDLREYNISENDKTAFQKAIQNFDSFYLIITHSHENPGGLLRIWSEERCLEATSISIRGMQMVNYAKCSNSAIPTSTESS